MKNGKKNDEIFCKRKMSGGTGYKKLRKLTANQHSYATDKNKR